MCDHSHSSLRDSLMSHVSCLVLPVSGEDLVVELPPAGADRDVT